VTTGTLLVAIASLLWATDAAFRLPILRSIEPSTLVLLEHLLALALLIPFSRSQREPLIPRDFSQKEWIAAAWVGMGGSGFATLLFTASFRSLNPSVAILLQKIQPVVVVALATVFLKERPRFSFYPWAAIALLSAIILAFPDLNFDFVSFENMNPRSQGVIMAVSSALIWAVSTIAGKKLLNHRAPLQTTRVRYLFGALAVSLIELIRLTSDYLSMNPSPMQGISPHENWELHRWGALIYVAWIPGLAAMSLYYTGMKRTPAVVTTFAELLFPLGAILINTLYLNMPLEPIQILAGATLMGAVTLITLSMKRPDSSVGPQAFDLRIQM